MSYKIFNKVKEMKTNHGSHDMNSFFLSPMYKTAVLAFHKFMKAHFILTIFNDVI